MHSSLTQPKKRIFKFFGAALFLRPSKQEQRAQSLTFNIATLAALARKNPDEWECLLMKRNYLDFCWDHIGGNREKDEFPLQAMQREVQEEVGWKIKEYQEVCRQWKSGFLNGFIYLVIPAEPHFMEDKPPRELCDEVQTVEYFNLLHILSSEMFNANVKGRIRAFIDNTPDFSLQ